MNLSILKAEILSNQQYSLFVQTGNDKGIMDLLNEKKITISVWEPVVPIWKILAWAASSGRYEKLEDATKNGAAGVKSLAAAALKILDSLPDFNLDEPILIDLITNALLVNLLNESDVVALRALGNRQPASRAEELFGAGTIVTLQDVSTALRANG